MRPDATSPFPSPFLEVPEAEWLCANDLCFAIFDSFPVSSGHVLVITRRVVPTYFDCTAAEQAAVMELVGEVKRLLEARLEPKPDGYNVGFNAGAAAGQTVPHVHVHVIPRYAGDMPDPRGGVRHVIPEKGNYLAGLGHPHPSPLPEGEGVTEAHPTRRDTVSSPLPRGEAGRRPGERLCWLSRGNGADHSARKCFTGIEFHPFTAWQLPDEAATTGSSSESR
jgi:diadenosine tetraphosphate (Ap4A) HIT family hydrolase